MITGGVPRPFVHSPLVVTIDAIYSRLTGGVDPLYIQWRRSTQGWNSVSEVGNSVILMWADDDGG